MKKLFAIVLVVLMMLSLAACGGDEPTPTTVPETTAPVEQGSKLGTVEGNTYTNEFLGITVTLNENWGFANDEEMAQIRGMTTDAMTDENLAEILETSGAVMDMYAADVDGQTLNIMLENLNILQSIAVTEKAYADATVGQLPAALESMGFADATAEVTELTFAGDTHAAVKIHAKIAGMNFYETLVIVKQGNYIACITAASYGEDTTSAVLDLFAAI